MFSKLKLIIISLLLVGILTACQQAPGLHSPDTSPSVPPPPTSLGYYVTTPSSEIQPDFFAEAYRGCQEAYLDEVGTGNSVIELHFGGEEAGIAAGQDGTVLITKDNNLTYSFSNIAQYTSSFAGGYEACANNIVAQGGYSPSTHIDIVVTNFFLSNVSGSIDYTLGSEMAAQALAQTIAGYNYLTNGSATPSVVTLGLGDDIEPDFSTPSAALEWMAGVQAGLAVTTGASQITPDFFGSADCYSSYQFCGNRGWTPQEIEQVAFSNSQIAMPQIYYQPGDGAEWASLTQQATYTYDYINVTSGNEGITSSEGDTPSDSAWQSYWQQLNNTSSLEYSSYNGLDYITSFCSSGALGSGVCETPQQYCSLNNTQNCSLYLTDVTNAQNADPANNVFAPSTLPSKAPKMINPSLYVTDFANGNIVQVDTTTTATLGLRLGFHGSISSIAHIKGNEFIAVDNTHNQVLIINNGIEVKAIPVGLKPTEVAVSLYHRHKYALVTDTGSNQVTPIDLNSLVGLPPITVGSAPFGIAISQQSNTAYVCDTGSNEITPIDLSTLSPEAPITNIKTPIGIALSSNAKYALVTDTGSNQVTPIDLKKMQVLSPITVGSHPIGIAISNNNKLAYVANFGSSTISEINLKTLSQQSTLNVPGDPITIAISNDNTIYVTLFNTGLIAELKTTNDNSVTLVKTIHVGPEPVGITTIHSNH